MVVISSHVALVSLFSLHSVCLCFSRTPSFLTWSAAQSHWSERPRRTRPSRWTPPCWAGAGCWSWSGCLWRRWARSWTGPWPRSVSGSWDENYQILKIKTKQMDTSKSQVRGVPNVMTGNHPPSVLFCSWLRDLSQLINGRSGPVAVGAAAIFHTRFQFDMLTEKNLHMSCSCLLAHFYPG